MSPHPLSRPVYDPRRRYRARRLFLHPELRPQPCAPVKASQNRVEALDSELVESRNKLQHSEAQWKEMKEQFLRIRAEFDNFRKRTLKEKDDLKKFAQQGFVEALLPVLDSFDQAEAALTLTEDVQAFAQGFGAIKQQLENALRGQGFEKVDAQGKLFDPHFHEALAVVKVADDIPEDTVYDVLQNGYLLNGRLVRPARVRIAKKE